MFTLMHVEALRQIALAWNVDRKKETYAEITGGLVMDLLGYACATRFCRLASCVGQPAPIPGIPLFSNSIQFDGNFMNLTTPALLFPAISLLLVAFTNRFLVTAQLIRQLHVKYESEAKEVVLRQISNLRTRIVLMRRMQAMGVSAFILCALSMFLIFIDFQMIAQVVFGSSIFLLVMALLVSLYEISISTKAIEIEIEDMEQALGLHRQQR